MKDVYEDAKNAAKRRMEREADQTKASFIREVKHGLGEQMKKELTVQSEAKPPSRWKRFLNKLKKVFDL